MVLTSSLVGAAMSFSALHLRSSRNLEGTPGAEELLLKIKHFCGERWKRRQSNWHEKEPVLEFAKTFYISAKVICAVMEAFFARII